jgi:hypothetical protein
MACVFCTSRTAHLVLWCIVAYTLLKCIDKARRTKTLYIMRSCPLEIVWVYPWQMVDESEERSNVVILPMRFNGALLNIPAPSHFFPTSFRSPCPFFPNPKSFTASNFSPSEWLIFRRRSHPSILNSIYGRRTAGPGSNISDGYWTDCGVDPVLTILQLWYVQWYIILWVHCLPYCITSEQASPHSLILLLHCLYH